MTRRTIARLMAGIAVSAAAAIGPAGCRTPDVTGTPGDEPGGKYITAVTEEGQLDRILAAETRKPVIVYFKTPYCGDVTAHAQIVAECPVPLVAAGGPRAETLEAALALLAQVIQSGARGATIGRNVWGFERITAAVTAFKAVIHDGQSPEEALRIAGL